MREFRNKGMPKPYRDRRKRSKYTKSVNVPYFEEIGELSLLKIKQMRKNETISKQLN
jgi:hypothetical protein